jgi:hypothetical protein
MIVLMNQRKFSPFFELYCFSIILSGDTFCIEYSRRLDGGQAMKQISKFSLFIFALMILTLSAKTHATNHMVSELNTHLNFLVDEEVLSLLKSDSLKFFEVADPLYKKFLQEKTQVQKKLQSKKSLIELVDLPLFQINVEQDGRTDYLNEIRLKAELVPRPGVTAALEAVKDRTVYFLIDGNFVGKAKGLPSSTKFVVSAEETLQYRFRPGRHKVMALAAHDGTIVMGNGILKVDKGRAKIQETTSDLSNMYYGYKGQKQYYACHSEGDIITVSARFTDANHPDVPVINAKVYFRNHAVVLSETRTDGNGDAFFSFKLTRASMLKSGLTWTFHEGRPISIVGTNLNFFMEENVRYNEKTDWGSVYRSMCACPKGYTLSEDRNTCIKK